MASLQAFSTSQPQVMFSRPLTNFPSTKWGQVLTCFPLKAKSVVTAVRAQSPAANAEQQISRRLLTNNPQSMWNDDAFLNYSLDVSEYESYARQIQALKEEVKHAFMTLSDPLETINLIDTLCRLGVSYHFENEIEDNLSNIFTTLPHLVADDDYDLHTVALLFRVLRQYGYKVSCDVFNKFLGDDGKFKDSLTRDVKGMLNLYEAANLRFHGEDILEEALAMTTAHLESLANQSSPHLREHIMNALYRPFQKGLPRVEAWVYISFYEQEESRNEALLKFAKLDFNLLQSLHLQELKDLLSWWRNLDFTVKLPYARDRLVDLYFWGSAVLFEPQYAQARMVFTKSVMFFSLIDDTYDSYGTFQELQHFTNAIQRWDNAAVDQLPDYMKILYRGLIDLYEEFEKDSTDEGKSFGVSYSIKLIKQLCQAYMVDIQWTNDDYVPSFDEYMVNGLITAAIHLLTVSMFLGMGKSAGINAYEWIDSNPKALAATNEIARLTDDIVTHEVEHERGLVASSIRCYMKQYGVPKKKALEEIEKMAENAWKTLNEECMRPNPVQRHLLMVVVNFARLVDVVYKYSDGYSKAEGFLKKCMAGWLIDRMPI